MTTKLSLPPTADALAAAFEKQLPAFMKLPDDQVLPRLNFDVAAAVATVLGAQPALRKLRGELLALPNMNAAYIDHLDSIAYAALHAHMRSITTAPEENLLPKLTEKARLARRTLQTDAASAINHGLLPEDALNEIPTGGSRIEIAQGLLGLGLVFRAAWADLKNRTPVTMETLDASARLGVELLTELGREDNPTTSKSDDTNGLIRLRACSFLAHVYDECRRGVTFVRWHFDDVNDFAPPLSGPRGGARPKTDEQPPDPTPDKPDGGGKPNP